MKMYVEHNKVTLSLDPDNELLRCPFQVLQKLPSNV